MQRSATQGELLDAPDSWTAGRARGPESTRHTILSLCYVLHLDVLHLKSYFIIFDFNPFPPKFFPEAISTVFLWAESFISKWIFFSFFFWGGYIWSHGRVQEGFHTGAIWPPLMQSFNSAAFLCWHFLPLWAHSYWLLRAHMGVWEGELLNAKDIWPPPQAIPLSTSLLFCSPMYKYCTCMHIHALPYRWVDSLEVNDWS